MRSLEVPIVCSEDSQIGEMSPAYYCLANMSSVRTARLGSNSELAGWLRERSEQFATWLTQHPAIGLKQMLRLTRQVLEVQSPSTSTATTSILLHTPGTRSEVRLLVARPVAQAVALVLQSPRARSTASHGQRSALWSLWSPCSRRACSERCTASKGASRVRSTVATAMTALASRLLLSRLFEKARRMNRKLCSARRRSPTTRPTCRCRSRRRSS